MYDLIGDIHGHADELTELLRRLGYNDRQGYFSHPSRKAFFVGDFIDRGLQIREVLHIVRPMIDQRAAFAVMGNHEFNAIAYHTEIPGSPGQHFREHSSKNKNQHEATLNQLQPKELAEFVEWFKSLPVAWERDGLRVVHACWDREGIDTIEAGLAKFGGFSPDFLREATIKDRPTKLYQAVEDVLKGKEAKLPGGAFFLDKDGNKRHDVRVRWYESPEGRTIREYAFETEGKIPEDLIPTETMGAKPYPSTALPVFFGHYWLREGPPEILAPNVACVDYSVAKGGMLCAYRWNGEQQLSNRNFEAIKSRY
ncbi:MAG: metallophosphoesterase [Planctomycetales bacterium]|nr:metallophosphoesterase [Planctomycetales bacterium]